MLPPNVPPQQLEMIAAKNAVVGSIAASRPKKKIGTCHGCSLTKGILDFQSRPRSIIDAEHTPTTPRIVAVGTSRVMDHVSIILGGLSVRFALKIISTEDWTATVRKITTGLLPRD